MLASAPGFGLASCKSNAPEQVVANGAKDDGVEVKTRLSTAMNGKLAWGGLVTNTSDRFVRGADFTIAVRKGGGTVIGQGQGRAGRAESFSSRRDTASSSK